MDLDHLERLLDLLREKGVLCMKEGDLEIQLVPKQEVVSPMRLEHSKANGSEDPYQNPDAYGAGGFVPSFDEGTMKKSA